MIPVLNTTGLVLNLIGVLLLFRYGMPYRVANDRGSYLITESVHPDEQKITNRYRVLGNLGLAMIIFGTLSQGTATWLPTR